MRWTRKKCNIPKLRDVVKVLLAGKFVALNAYIIKKWRYQINSLCFQPKEIEKEWINSKQAEENKMESNEIEHIKTVELRHPKVSSLNRSTKSLFRLTKDKRDKTQNTKIRNKIGDVTYRLT